MRFAELSDRAIQTMGRLPSAIIEWLGRVPTTNLRVCVTLVVVLVTTGRYVSSGSWTPSVEWLAFLVALSGVDSLTFVAKRKTQHVPPTGTE